MTDLPKGFGRRNPHCTNCGDERGGPFGHEISECRYRSGMTAAELTETMPPEKASAYWDVLIDRYLDQKLAALTTTEGDPVTPQTFRKKPVEIQAVQWTGDNQGEMADFVGWGFGLVDPEDRGDDLDITGEVYDALHSTWVGVKNGQWVIRGIKGEFYPCDPEVFAETYDRVKP